MIDETIKNLRANGFDARFAKNREEAKILLGEFIVPGSIVAYGGSMTLAEIGFEELVKEHKARVISHWQSNDPAERKRLMREAFSANLYCASSNAVTMDGKLVNIDGMGNRVASMIYGPDKVILVVGVNKIVENLEGAYDRLHKIACPKNSARLQKKTPCVNTGVCMDCNSPERICRITTIIERQPMMTDMTIIIIDENLGL